MNTQTWPTIVARATAAILLCAGIERLLIAATNASVLALPDPVLGIPLRITAATVGVIELATAAFCLNARSPRYPLALTAWLTTNYIAYWIGAHLMGCHPQTTAIGSLTDPLRLANGTLGHIIALIPPALLLTSITTLFLTRPKKAPAKPAPKPLIGPQKMACPACGLHIRFEADQAGQQIPCPQCKTTITLRPPEILKTTCPQCSGHIEFPSHALGRKMPCPHCKGELTLKETV
jgi:hypothetical protein